MTGPEPALAKEIQRLNTKLDKLFDTIHEAAKTSFNDNQILLDHVDKRFRDLYGLIESLVREGYLRPGFLSPSRAASNVKYTFRYLRNDLEKDGKERKGWRSSVRDDWKKERKHWKEEPKDADS